MCKKLKWPNELVESENYIVEVLLRNTKFFKKSNKEHLVVEL